MTPSHYPLNPNPEALATCKRVIEGNSNEKAKQALRQLEASLNTLQNMCKEVENPQPIQIYKA